MTKIVYEAPGIRYMASAFGKDTWISSRSSSLYGKTIKFAHAYRNSFGFVSFAWCETEDEANDHITAFRDSVLGGFDEKDHTIVPITGRPETMEEANPQ